MKVELDAALLSLGTYAHERAFGDTATARLGCRIGRFGADGAARDAVAESSVRARDVDGITGRPGLET